MNDFELARSLDWLCWETRPARRRLTWDGLPGSPGHSRRWPGRAEPRPRLHAEDRGGRQRDDAADHIVRTGGRAAQPQRNAHQPRQRVRIAPLILPLVFLHVIELE